MYMYINVMCVLYWYTHICVLEYYKNNIYTYVDNIYIYIYIIGKI